MKFTLMALVMHLLSLCATASDLQVYKFCRLHNPYNVYITIIFYALLHFRKSDKLTKENFKLCTVW